MDFEKKVFIILGIVVGLIVILSFNNDFTGYAVSDYDDAIEYEHVYPGEIIKGSLNIDVEGEGILNELVQVSGEGAEWVVLEDSEYVLIPGIVNKIPYTIEVPENVEEGVYRASFAVTSVQDFEKKSMISNQVLYHLDVYLNVNRFVEDGIVVSGLEIFDTDNENVGFELEIENKGNKVEDLEIDINIFDLGLVAEKSFKGEIYAYETQDISYSFVEDLDVGEYFADVYVKVGDTRKKMSTSFSVVDDGLVKKAKILGSAVYVENNNVYVTSYVENSGEGMLEVYLSGDVNNIIFETDEQEILPGNYGVFKYVLEGNEAGEYLLDTNVHYDDVVLAEEETGFYVSDNGVVSLEMSFIAIFAFIILALVVSHFLLEKKLKK